MTDPRTYGLTDKAAELLRYIRLCADTGRGTPTYQQMADAVGLASKSGIHRLVKQLVDRGLIRTLPGRGQSITLNDLASYSLSPAADARLRATAKAMGRTPAEHLAALVLHHCPASHSA